MNEEWTIGYEEGYQAGWNDAMDAKPAREWVGLTDEERKDIWVDYDTDMDALKAIEAKLREKNHG